jgi:prophage antirepressor-like protein
MNLIQHPQFGEVRTEKHNGEFVFCAKDVCEILTISKYRDAMSLLDEDERVSKNTDTPGGRQEMIFVTESGLYALVMRCHKPEARKFRRWVTSEVLPALRQFGTYSIDANVMDRAKIKADKLATKRLLAELRKVLSTTDRRMVAKQCHTTEYTVNRVLDGQTQDATMLGILYERANTSIRLTKLFYTLEGANSLSIELARAKAEKVSLNK